MVESPVIGSKEAPSPRASPMFRCITEFVLDGQWNHAVFCIFQMYGKLLGPASGCLFASPNRRTRAVLNASARPNPGIVAGFCAALKFFNIWRYDFVKDASSRRPAKVF